MVSISTGYTACFLIHVERDKLAGYLAPMLYKMQFKKTKRLFDHQLHVPDTMEDISNLDA